MKRKFIPNQTFIGLPWKNVRPKYERVIRRLEKKYPLYFTIVGRDDGQDAVSLFEVIKTRIGSSSYAIFDATGGNANVSLEYGYAEGIDVPRAIFLSAHKSSQRNNAGHPIISDLTGMRRVQYTTEAKLALELDKLCRDHDYTKRFEKAMQPMLKRRSPGAKKRTRALAIKLVRALDGKMKRRRAELVQHLQADGYKESEIENALRGLRNIVKCTAGKYSDVYIA
jgi:hypothetical protein